MGQRNCLSGDSNDMKFVGLTSLAVGCTALEDWRRSREIGRVAEAGRTGFAEREVIPPERMHRELLTMICLIVACTLAKCLTDLDYCNFIIPTQVYPHTIRSELDRAAAFSTDRELHSEEAH
jgi:hypothetical protein